MNYLTSFVVVLLRSFPLIIGGLIDENQNPFGSLNQRTPVVGLCQLQLHGCTAYAARPIFEVCLK